MDKLQALCSDITEEAAEILHRLGLLNYSDMARFGYIR